MWKRVCLAAGLLVATALANTEKAIFLGPETVNIPPTHPNLQDLHIDTLTPAQWAVRTHLDAQFPTDGARFGRATWLALDELTEGQRYEVRVCWAATTLMAEVPPVLVDIILDPYIFNVLPRSLVPTVGYIVIIAVFSWFLASRISTWIRGLATSQQSPTKKDL
ncbi:hypothetical protein KJ359_011287 [Pestalotiopsis sp. 9143b]|nr:hypothetical protein KJ359_011287 [Pestalotiopsis sp. 9143b]